MKSTATTAPTHTCKADGCSQQIGISMLMCPRHWCMVPRKLQQEVWRHYRRGQESNREMVTDSYIVAATDAVEAVALKEARARQEHAQGNLL